MKRPTFSRPHVKERFRGVILALQSDARAYPGGLTELAGQIGRNYGSLKNALCPTNYDSEPTAELLLEVVETCGGAQTARAVARLAGMVAVPVATSSDCPREVMSAFLDVVRDAGKVNETTAEALSDGRLTHDERTQVADLLDSLISAAVAMREVVRG